MHVHGLFSHVSHTFPLYGVQFVPEASAVYSTCLSAVVLSFICVLTPALRYPDKQADLFSNEFLTISEYYD